MSQIKAAACNVNSDFEKPLKRATHLLNITSEREDVNNKFKTEGCKDYEYPGDEYFFLRLIEILPERLLSLLVIY